MNQKENSLILKIRNCTLVKFVRCYFWETLYVLAMTLILCVIYRDDIFNDATKLSVIIGVLPIPIAIIKYIKEMDLKTKLDVIEENVLFNKEILKNDTMAQFRKLVFKFSIIKNSWNTTYFIEAVISSLVGLVDSDLKNQNKNEQINLDYLTIKNKFESIDAAVHGFENSFGKGYDVEYIIKKYFNHIGAKFDEEFNSSKIKEIFQRYLDEKGNYSINKYYKCKFQITDEIKDSINDKQLRLFLQDCIDCKFYSDTYFKNEIDINISEDESMEEIEIIISSKDEFIKNKENTITKKSRDYLKENDNTYLAQGWFIIRQVDFDTKYNGIENIVFNIHKDDFIYSATLTYSQLKNLIAHKHPDTRGNYHFYFWIKKDKNNIYLVDGRNGLNKIYFSKNK